MTNIIAKKYKLINKISGGSFGEVFKGENIRSGEMVAIKIEKKIDEIKTLKNEAKIYQYLGKKEGFAQLKWFGTSDKINYLVIDLLGYSLTKMLEYFKVFSLKTVILLGIQMVQRIHILHDHSLLHRDIKPDNFLFGVGQNISKLYLIDLGFCKRYAYDKKHIEEKTISNIIGTPNFVSLNVHNGIEPSRRDDITSCVYIIAYMLLGKLEWFEISDLKQMYIIKTKLATLNEIPIFIKNMLQYCNNIKFNDKPDYNYLIDILKKEFHDNGLKNDGNYEWYNYINEK